MRIAYTNMNLNFKKQNGLIPAIIQDANTCKVLMLGFMNKEAYQKTRRVKRVTFYSRSKKRLWTKGETSGNYLEVIDIKPDCDRDAILIKAIPKGPTCHSGAYSCFGEESGNNIIFFESLRALVEKRKHDMPLVPSAGEGSYTASLFRAGISKIGAKVTEEAEEVARAATSEGKARVIEEISDLLYHLTVLMAETKVDWWDIEQCLILRKG